jgi:hypothetical protein
MDKQKDRWMHGQDIQSTNKIYRRKGDTSLDKMKNVQPHAWIMARKQTLSPTFYEQLLRQNPFAKKLLTQIVRT